MAEDSGSVLSNDRSESAATRHMADCSVPRWERTAAGLGATRREIDVVRAILEGNGEKQAAAGLGISRRATHARLERLYRRLGIRSRTELIVKILSEFDGS